MNIRLWLTSALTAAITAIAILVAMTDTAMADKATAKKKPAKSFKYLQPVAVNSSKTAKKAAPVKQAKAAKAAKIEPSKESASRLRPSAGNSRLQREVVFDGSTVSGQYHAAGEAVAKVEQEKKMNDLIGMRRDFKDRLAAERERLKRGEDVAVD